MAAMRSMAPRSEVMQAITARRTEYLFHGEILEESRRITSKANLWADLGSRGQMAAAVRQAAACGLKGAREVAVCPEWRDTSALRAAARVRDPPAPHPTRCEAAGVTARAGPVPGRAEAALPVCAANADRKGGRKSTGVRGWLTYCVYGLGLSPVPDPLDTSAEHRREVEERLEDFAVWYAVCRPSGKQASYKTIGKYVSSVRAWYRRFYSAELGQGARGSRIRDILKGYGRAVDQPPPMERIGCAPVDLARGMHGVRAGVGARRGAVHVARGADFRYVGNGAGGGDCTRRWSS